MTRAASRLALLLAAAGLVPYALRYRDARLLRRAPAAVGGKLLTDPAVARDEHRWVLERRLSLDQILARRHLDRPDPDTVRLGCPSAPGLSRRDGAPLVLLAFAPWGRIAEAPDRGITVVSYREAADLAAPGRCAPLMPRAIPAPPGAMR